MTPNRVAVAMEKYEKNIPEYDRSSFKDALIAADDQCLDEFMYIPIKSRVATVLFSVFLGGLGVDRFYLGEIMPGVAKLVFNICATFLGTIDISLGVIFSLIRSIWAITDIFVCYKHCKIHNYQKLVAFLRSHEAERVPRNSNSFSQHNNSDNSRPETPKKEVSLEPIVEKNEEEPQTNNYRENVLPGVLTAIPVTVSTDWIFTCPQCSQKIRITVVAPNYSCPRCLRVISYSDISTLGGTK